MHQRPDLSNFLAIKTQAQLTIRLSLFLESIYYKQKSRQSTTPIESITKLKKSRFSLLLECFDGTGDKLLSKIYESNSFGNFFIKITDGTVVDRIERIQVYEIEYSRGIEFYLGAFRPLDLSASDGIIISDFDKTLADTRYSTTKEIYQSLTKPLDFFPTIEKSVDLLKKFTDEGLHPFILTASPHFYEDAIRDWLYAHNIFTAGIFLKDFRKALSFIPAELAPKDLKIQGFYKLNQILNILLMTGIPSSIVLMGDNWESDPAIYATIALMLENKLEAWQIWKRVNSLPEFQFTNQQNADILSKLYQIETLKKRQLADIDIKIYIRKLKGREECHFKTDIFNTIKPKIVLF